MELHQIEDTVSKHPSHYQVRVKLTMKMKMELSSQSSTAADWWARVSKGFQQRAEICFLTHVQLEEPWEKDSPV